tara:strand:+ start:3990 stop:4721 length:732 start_codon:yes stop_codon:yes gene_type:complete
MCEPVSIALGVASAAGGMMQAKAQHNAAKAAAQRQNHINELNYRNNLNIASAKDKAKARDYDRKLAAAAAAQTALAQQKQLNVQERNRASIAAQQKLEEVGTEIAFEQQAAIIKQIQAQGTILAGEQQSGQSMLLSIMDTERALGFEDAQLSASMVDANKAYRIAEYGFDLDNYTADVIAMNRLPAAPVAQSASFMPIKQPKVQGPSGLGLMGGMLSAVAGGASTGLSAQRAIQGGEDHLWKN